MGCTRYSYINDYVLISHAKYQIDLLNKILSLDYV